MFHMHSTAVLRHSEVVFHSVQNLATNLVLLSQLFGQLSQQRPHPARPGIAR